MFKKILKINLLILILFLTSLPSVSAENDENLYLEKISRVGFNKILNLDPKQEIQNLFSKYDKYANSHNLEKFKSLYAENYLNSDGFDKETYFKIIERSWTTYPDVSYSTQIQNISINGNYATVKLTEYATGKTKELFASIKEEGEIKSKSEVIFQLQKYANEWLIISNMTLEETTSLKYGDAKGINISLDAPNLIKEGEQYTTTMNIDIPANTFVLASLTNEPIIFPQSQPKDVFRNMKGSSVLERIFTANTQNHNEYAVASVGLTKASVINSQNININVTGMAFLMTRVNVLKKQEVKQIDIKEATNTENEKG